MKPPKHNAPLVLVLFLAVAMLTGGLVFYFAGHPSSRVLTLRGNLKGYFQTHRAPREMPSSRLASFSSLHEDFEKGGMPEFRRKKEDLRETVGRILGTEGDTPERDRAENIALYLYPDLLSKDDFERGVAFEQWLPQQARIEKKPKSIEGRESFVELKNNVWNYENTDRQVPAISEYAEEVIRIYDALSRVE